MKKEGEKTKKRLTGRGKFGNMDKLSQGAELPRLETKKDEKKQLTNEATCDILKKLAKSERDRKIENIENFIV